MKLTPAEQAAADSIAESPGFIAEMGALLARRAVEAAKPIIAAAALRAAADSITDPSAPGPITWHAVVEALHRRAERIEEGKTDADPT